MHSCVFLPWLFVLHFMPKDLHFACVHTVYRMRQWIFTAYHYRTLSLGARPLWWRRVNGNHKKIKRLPLSHHWRAEGETKKYVIISSTLLTFANCENEWGSKTIWQLDVVSAKKATFFSKNVTKPKLPTQRQCVDLSSTTVVSWQVKKK